MEPIVRRVFLLVTHFSPQLGHADHTKRERWDDVKPRVKRMANWHALMIPFQRQRNRSSRARRIGSCPLEGRANLISRQEIHQVDKRHVERGGRRNRRAPLNRKHYSPKSSRTIAKKNKAAAAVDETKNKELPSFPRRTSAVEMKPFKARQLYSQLFSNYFNFDVMQTWSRLFSTVSRQKRALRHNSNSLCTVLGTRACWKSNSKPCPRTFFLKLSSRSSRYWDGEYNNRQIQYFRLKLSEEWLKSNGSLTTPSPRLTTSQGRLAVEPRWAVMSVPLAVVKRAEDVAVKPGESNWSDGKLLVVDNVLLDWPSDSNLLRLESVVKESTDKRTRT